MNDVTTAREPVDAHTEERDFVELGEVSKDTHGNWIGYYPDGVHGFYG